MLNSHLYFFCELPNHVLGTLIVLETTRRYKIQARFRTTYKKQRRQRSSIRFGQKALWKKLRRKIYSISSKSESVKSEYEGNF